MQLVENRAVWDFL